MYKIPADTKEKEKVIGGVITMEQFLWLGGGLVIGLLMFIGAWVITTNIFVGLFFFVAGIAMALPFAFYKKKHLTFFNYLKYKRQLTKRNVYLPNNKKENAK